MTLHQLDKDLEVVRKKRREIYETLVRQKLELMPGFLELIKLLQRKKLKTAVASSRMYEHIHLMLEVVEINHFPQVIVGPSAQIKRKHEPDIYLHAAAGLGLQPQECLALEDSETGVLSACNARMKVIAMPSKYTAHQNFDKADKIVNNLGEITVSVIQSFNNPH